MKKTTKKKSTKQKVKLVEKIEEDFFTNLAAHCDGDEDDEDFYEELEPVMVSRLGWYGEIEAPVRPLVQLLRDNGFNTTNSCGHDMTVEIDLGSHLDEAERMASLLNENGYSVFFIETHLMVPNDGFWTRRATLHLGKWHN